MPPTLDTTLLDLHRWNIYTVYSRLVVARSRGSRHFPTKINSMRLGQDFPVISHVTFPCVNHNAFRCGSTTPALGPWRFLGSSRRCWSPSCTRPSAWWRLWTSTPVCWGIRRRRWTRRVCGNHRESGLILAYGSVKKNQHENAEAQEDDGYLYIYIHICECLGVSGNWMNSFERTIILKFMIILGKTIVSQLILNTPLI